MDGTLAAGSLGDMAGNVLPRGTGHERRLLDAIHQGDRQAGEELVDRTYGAVYAALLRLCGGDRDLAADLTQETFRKAWEALAEFNGRSKASTWLYRIAYNVFLNHARRPVRAVPLDGSMPLTIADPAPGAEENLSRAEVSRRLRAAVLNLPEDLRFAVTARFWANLPVREIAWSEGVTGVAIRKRLRKAFDLLQLAMNRGPS